MLKRETPKKTNKFAYFHLLGYINGSKTKMIGLDKLVKQFPLTKKNSLTRTHSM